jgi:hypothetical protein
VGRAARRARLARAAALALALTALAAATAPPAWSAWSRPVRFSPPEQLDVNPAQIAFAAGGQAAIGFSVHDQDNPGNSSAWVTLRSPGGRVDRPRRVPHSQQVLAVAYEGSTLELLTGDSHRGEACCSVVQVVPFAAGRFDRAQTVVRGLTGFTLGRLVPLPGGQLLAAVATTHGVWTAQSAGSGFGPAQNLAAAGSNPQTLVATSLPNGHSFVAWTASQGTATGPRTILVAEGDQTAPPTVRRSAIAVPAGHQVDELAVADGVYAPAFAWIESWFDTNGVFHSQAAVADLARSPRVRTFPVGGELAAGLSFSSDAAGSQALGWKTCTQYSKCSVHAAVRPARRHFGATQRLGVIDASQDPAVAFGRRGAALLAWISAGHVFAASRHAGSLHFGATNEVSATNFAADLALAFGPTGEAVAAWTQGTLAPALVGAAWRG